MGQGVQDSATTHKIGGGSGLWKNVPVVIRNHVINPTQFTNPFWQSKLITGRIYLIIMEIISGPNIFILGWGCRLVPDTYPC